MAGKPGTRVGRMLLKFIPKDSVLHSVAEAVDLTAEHILFDSKKEAEVPVTQLSEVDSFVDQGKALLLVLLEKGLVKLDIPGVDGDNEAQVEKALLSIVEAYVNEVID